MREIKTAIRDEFSGSVPQVDKISLTVTDLGADIFRYNSYAGITKTQYISLTTDEAKLLVKSLKEGLEMAEKNNG